MNAYLRCTAVLLAASALACGGQATQAPAADAAAAQPPAGAPAGREDSPLWSVELVERGGDVGLYSSLGVDGGGHPHIAYFDQMNNRLKYASFDGSWHVEQVDDHGGALAMALDGAGRPQIAYSKTTPGEMDLARSQPGGWHSEKVDAVSFPAYAMTIDSAGRPHIAYRDFSESCRDDLKYAFYDHAWKITTVDAKTCSGQSVAIALARDGKPRVVYNRDYPLGDLEYASFDGAWHIEKVDSGNAGRYCSLALDAQGNPHVSYYAAGKLKHAYKNGTWHTEMVDGQGDVGFYSSLALDAQGNPRISYWDVSRGRLKYAYKSGGWRTEVVDSKGKVGLYSSLALDAAGRPHVSYYDATTRSLKYARRKT